MAPLAVVGLPERPPVARGPAEVDVQEGEALARQQQLERLEAAVGLPGRSAVRVDDGRDPLAAALPGRGARPPQGAFDAQAVAGLDGDPLAGGHAARGQAGREDGGAGIGDLARAGAVGGHARDGQQPQVLRPGLALADRRDPGAVGQPADGPPDAVPRRDPLGLRGRGDGARGLGRPSAATLGLRGLAQAAHDQVDQAVVDLDVDDAAAIRRRQRGVPVAPRRLAVLALAVGEDDAVTAIRGAAHDLEPPVGVGHVDQRPVGQPLRAGVVAALARHDLALAGRDVDDRRSARSSGPRAPAGP